jgi:hypothetical protein
MCNGCVDKCLFAGRLHRPIHTLERSRIHSSLQRVCPSPAFLHNCCTVDSIDMRYAIRTWLCAYTEQVGVILAVAFWRQRQCKPNDSTLRNEKLRLSFPSYKKINFLKILSQLLTRDSQKCDENRHSCLILQTLLPVCSITCLD